MKPQEADWRCQIEMCCARENSRLPAGGSQFVLYSRKAVTARAYRPSAVTEATFCAVDLRCFERLRSTT